MSNKKDILIGLGIVLLIVAIIVLVKIRKKKAASATLETPSPQKITPPSARILAAKVDGTKATGTDSATLIVKQSSFPSLAIPAYI